MIYDKNYKNVEGTNRINPKIFVSIDEKESDDVKSFHISGDKYKDNRRVVTRKFR